MNATTPTPGSDAVLLVRDFVNTVEWQEDADSWADPADLERWFADRAGIVVAHQTEGDLALARRLREGLRNVLVQHAGHEPVAGAARDLNEVLAGIPLRLRVGGGGALSVAGDGGDDAPADPLAVIISAVDSARVNQVWDRLKVCVRDSCRWAYWDASRNRSGRWCSMSGCGNYVKMRTRNGDPLSPSELTPERGGRRPARLLDVAARAGVSMKTVSNVVNSSAPVSAATRARVEAAILALDYSPNPVARALRNGEFGGSDISTRG